MEMERNELLRCKTAQTQQKQLWAGRGWGGDAALVGGELELELVLTGGIKGIPVSLCTAHSTLRATLTGVKLAHPQPTILAQNHTIQTSNVAFIFVHCVPKQKKKKI